jgi:hypothetical protein
LPLKVLLSAAEHPEESDTYKIESCQQANLSATANAKS